MTKALVSIVYVTMLCTNTKRAYLSVSEGVSWVGLRVPTLKLVLKLKNEERVKEQADLA